jgi:ABC-2 type transport system permease protein
MSVESEVLSRLVRLEGAVRTAIIMEEIMPERVRFNYTVEQALSKWEQPPIRIQETTSAAIRTQDPGIESLAHTQPGMMLQFAIAGLLTSAQIMVEERKSRALQRMLTTATRRLHILFGHFLAILFLIVCQFTLLILFGQFILKVNYLAEPAAVALVAFCAALCIAALGLLIGVLARSEEQAIIFSLVPMFVLAGLGGAWVPLEFTGKVFQTIGHVSPGAWALDGFKNITLRGLGMESVLLPAAALLSYGIVFFLLATLRFRRVSE